MEIEKNYWVPVDITTKILSRLPAGSVLRFKSVCKTWQALLSDPIFHDLHFRQLLSLQERDCRCVHNLRDPHTHDKLFLSVDKSAKNQLEFVEYKVDQDHDCFRLIKGTGGHFLQTVMGNIGTGHELSVGFATFQVVGSCNGLLCLRIPYRGKDCMPRYFTSVYNPISGEYANIPAVPELSNGTKSHKELSYSEHHFAYFGHGFGYHSAKNKYKIVRTYMSCDPPESSQVYVGIYILGSGKWRRKVIPDSVSLPVRYIPKEKASVHLNGCLHWLTEVLELVSFDLASEEFKVTSTEIKGRNCTPYFGLLGGSLCIGDRSYSRDRLEISLMNLEGSCTRKFTVKCHNLYVYHSLRPIELLENGKILLHLNSKQLVVYDAKDESFVNVDIIGNSLESPTELPTMFKIVTPYMGSFVSLRALGETSSLAKRRKRKWQQE